MSALQERARAYLSMRRAMGHQLKGSEALLTRFVEHLDHAGAAVITTEHALAWATQPRGASPNWHAHRLAVARNFARWLRTIDALTEVPPADLLPHQKRRPTPYQFSVEDLTALLAATGSLGTELRRRTYHSLFALLSVTGLRVGEAIRLNRDDLDLHTATLLVRDTKFGKTRLVPLHPTTSHALRAYLKDRDRLHPRASTDALFIGGAGKRLERTTVNWVFRKVADNAGLKGGPGTRPPRLHDLRHSLAVNVMLDAYRGGADPRARLPLLATYLGHVHPGSTYWYLSAAPELMAIASERLEAHVSERP